MVEENIGEKTDNHGHGKDLMKFFSRFFFVLWDDDWWG